MKPEQRAVVSILWPDDAAVRPAMFVYATEDGFAWVEPGYVDPLASRPGIHVARGALTLLADGFNCTAPGGPIYLVRPLESLEGDLGADMAKAMDEAEAEILAAGRTVDEERVRMRELALAEAKDQAA